MKTNPKFKSLIPSLAPEEYAQLEANLVADGCRDALVTWQGTLIDGHNRLEICQRHGIKFKTEEMEFASEDHAMLWIRINQLGRRNLTDDQRAMIADAAVEIESRLAMQERASKGTPAREAKKHGHTLEAAPSAKVEKTRAKTARAAKVSERKMKKARAIRKKSPAMAAKVEAGELTLDAATKEIRAAEIAAQRTSIAASAATVKPSDRWQVHHADVATWKTEKQFDWIITDPPYPKEFLPLYETLARRAKDWLKDGGLLVAMCGQSYLNEIYAAMSKHLNYYWTACYFLPGQPTPLRQVNVNTTWKPLLIFSKGKYTGKIFGDVFKSNANEKDFHKWGQSESGMFDIVSKLAIPGQSILDPFCGAGTTGVSALRHGCLFEGVELDADNCKISTARLGDES